MRIADALSRYLTQLLADGRSHHTAGQYRRHVEPLAVWLSGNGRTDIVEEIAPARCRARRGGAGGGGARSPAPTSPVSPSRCHASSRASSYRWGSSSRSPRSSASVPYRPSLDPKSANQNRADRSSHIPGRGAAREARRFRLSGSSPALEPATPDSLPRASRDSGAGMSHPSRDRSRRSCRIQEDQDRRGTRSRGRDTNADLELGSEGKP